VPTSARKPSPASRPARLAGRTRTLASPLAPAVLVVDDDLDARNIYAQYLRMMGCAVFTATNGRSAVEKAIDLGPDLIVMDLVMPGMNGYEAMRELRESSWTSRIPIIAVSAVPMSRNAAFDAGCDAYLAKPCTPDVLWAQIRALLRPS
jgi:DNA-binding response OmpR family regulator